MQLLVTLMGFLHESDTNDYLGKWVEMKKIVELNIKEIESHNHFITELGDELSRLLGLIQFKIIKIEVMI